MAKAAALLLVDVGGGQMPLNNPGCHRMVPTKKPVSKGLHEQTAVFGLTGTALSIL